jgi:hypothetical protein
VSRLRGSGSNAATFAAIGGNLAIAVSKFIAAAVTRERGGREVKDAMTRDVLAALDAARIPIASATFALTELPPVPVRLQPQEEDSHA